jgi:gliding motility-associated-like protein
MKRNATFQAYFFLLFIVLLIPLSAFSQLTVSTGQTPNQLVQNVLVGSGVTVSNVTYSGAPGSIGYFTGGNGTNLGIHSGIVMSTGVVDGSNGQPLIGSPASNFVSWSNGTGSDPNLQTLIPGYTINDASVLQFDFIPLSDTISFRYVFGSEEYPEWVGSSFNDVFGFFVSGPNPLGGNYTNLNIARIPGTSLPVTIDNVNIGSYSQYYVNNEGIGGMTIVYDGFTTVLTAWCVVVPCVQYHIKIAIGDAGDSAYDSAVFLEENSFSSNAVTIQTYYSIPAAGNNAVEGCSDAYISFTLPNPTPIPLNITYAIQGTAINGTDYVTIPNSVTIPAGQDSVALTISPLMDGNIEGTETVVLIVQTTVCGGYDTISIDIIDNIPISVTASNDTTICGGSATIWAVGSGGIQPYVYSWNNGVGNVSSAVVTPTTTTNYVVTVTDLCNTSVTENVTIYVGSGNADAGPDTSICAGYTATLVATGGVGYLWSNGATTAMINVSPLTTTTYYVTVYGTCNASDSVTVFVNPSPIISATASPASILMGGTSTICATGGATYNWVSTPFDPSLSGQQNDPCPVVSPVLTTTYTVSSMDPNGCQGQDTVTVIVIPIFPQPDFDATPKNGCAPLLVQFTDYSTETVPGAIYTWDFGNGTHSHFQNPLAYYDQSGIYDVSLTITNPGGYTATMTAFMFIEVYPLPIAAFEVLPGTEISMLDPVAYFFDQSFGNPVTWNWSLGDGTTATTPDVIHAYSDYNDYTMRDTGTYNVSLVVLNQYGCTDTASIDIHLNPEHGLYIPTAFTPNNDGRNEVFAIKGFGILEEGFTLVIFNRWGVKVFETNDMNDYWDGTMKGNDSGPGTYVYKIEYKDVKRKYHFRTGTVTLIR